VAGKPSVIRRNIVANTVGGSATLLLNLLVTPFLIRILGAEAYGLLGLMTSLQIVFAVLDLGLSTTIVKEIASDTSLERSATRGLVSTLAVIYWGIALALGATLFLEADWIVHRWLHLQQMRPADAILGIRILALSVALRWPVSFYGGVITGTQELVRFNVVKVASTIVRLGLGLVVLLATRDLRTYLWWMALSALFEVVAYVSASIRLHPALRSWPTFDWRALRHVWQFSLSMNVIAILSIVFTQADRIIISHLRPLSELGYYSLAVSVVMSVSVIQGFITSAVLPAFAADYSAGLSARLRERYAKATQALIYVITLPTCIFIFFGYEVLQVWTTTEAADRAAVVLALFSLGFLFNASVSIAYTLAVATGNTRLPLRVNLVALVAYLPGLYLATSRWGIVGAASAWVLLNVYFLLLLLPLVEIRIVRSSVLRWAVANFFPFVFRGGVTFALAAAVASRITGGRGPLIPIVLCAVASVVYVVWGLYAVTPSLRADVRNLAHSLLSRPNPAL
jgi:O-antigen/teichoic acid export membrane protein